MDRDKLCFVVGVLVVLGVLFVYFFFFNRVWFLERVDSVRFLWCKIPFINCEGEGFEFEGTGSLILEVRDINNDLVSANYVLLQDNKVIGDGRINEAIQEEVLNLVGANYTLRAWKDIGDFDFYYGEKDFCQVNTTCFVVLHREAEVNLSCEKDKVKIIKDDGYIRKPLLCVAYSYGVFNLKITGFPDDSGLSRVPSRLVDKVDRCFQVGKEVNEEIENLVLGVGYDYKPEEGMSDYLRFMLIDECWQGTWTYGSCGIPDLYCETKP